MNALKRIENANPALGTTTPSQPRNEDTMIVLRVPANGAEGLCAGQDGTTVRGDGVRMRAQWRHQATVVSISGDVDAVTSDGVQGFATRLVLVGDPLVLDLSGVDFIAARGISVLIAVDDACRAAEVPWALIPSYVVSRILQLTACDTTLPTASSLPEAMRQVTAVIQARRRLALMTMVAARHSRRTG